MNLSPRDPRGRRLWFPWGRSRTKNRMLNRLPFRDTSGFCDVLAQIIPYGLSAFIRVISTINPVIGGFGGQFPVNSTFNPCRPAFGLGAYALFKLFSILSPPADGPRRPMPHDFMGRNQARVNVPVKDPAYSNLWGHWIFQLILPATLRGRSTPGVPTFTVAP